MRAIYGRMMCHGIISARQPAAINDIVEALPVTSRVMSPPAAVPTGDPPDAPPQNTGVDDGLVSRVPSWRRPTARY